MSDHTSINFDDTACAFAYKQNQELKKAHFLFSAIGKPWLVKLALKLVPIAIKWHIPLTKTILRKTIFPQFVGGETLDETSPVAKKLGNYQVEVILDYGVEGGENGDTEFDQSTNEFMRVIEYAATEANIPFMSVKVTGIARLALLEKLDELMKAGQGTLMKRYLAAIEQLPEQEREEWHKVRTRMLRICETAANKKVGVLIDAEETWIQDPVDALTILMMDSFNKNRIVVYNTLQMYRHDRLSFLKDSFVAAKERGFILGSKLVRGAYMDKERERAIEKGYPSPIHVDKAACDQDYNAAVAYCIDNIDQIALMVASHNEESNLQTTQLLLKKNYPLRHPHVHFSQLYGMSDHITFNLARAGCSVSKYLPFGPIKDVIPYLMRRAEENSSVSGSTGRELLLIKKEIQRRQL